MSEENGTSISDSYLELVHWQRLEEWEKREKRPTQKVYKSFDDAANAIDEFGPLEVCTDRANAFFTRTSGRFEDDIVAIRQSGLNVRRILISRKKFDYQYRDFQDCIDHVLSNNALGVEVEISHLQDYAEAIDVQAYGVDVERRYTRSEIDTVAVLQMLGIRDFCINEDPDGKETIEFVFAAGFTAGRVFSAVQNLMTLEPAARSSIEARHKAGEAGARASRDRRLQNLELLMREIEQLSGAVGLISEERIIEQALETLAVRQKGFPKSHKTHADYGTALRSEEPFKSRYEAVFSKNT